MANYSLVPVDYQPDFDGVSLVPVDHDPFGADGTTQPPPIQLAQTLLQPAQPEPAPPQPESSAQQPATGVGDPNVVAPTVGAQTAAPMQSNSYAAGYPTSNSPYGPSIINAVRGMFNPSFDEDKRIVSGIYDAAKDALLTPGRLMQPNPYPPGSEEAFWYEDQRQKAMIPAAANIAMMLAGLGLPMAESGAVGALGGKLPLVARGIDEEFHHPLPMYLGGDVKQELVPLATSLHREFHRGLDKVLPRRLTTAYYESLGPTEKQEALQKLATYTKNFDADHGTKLYDALLKNGFPTP